MNNLKNIREMKKLSQFELAKLADITPSDISRIENNKIYAYPGWRERLANALEVEEKEIWPDNNQI
jgi:transcriptional regulator with XRE-family HTH domain